MRRGLGGQDPSRRLGSRITDASQTRGGASWQRRSVWRSPVCGVDFFESGAGCAVPYASDGKLPVGEADHCGSHCCPCCFFGRRHCQQQCRKATKCQQWRLLVRPEASDDSISLRLLSGLAHRSYEGGTVSMPDNFSEGCTRVFQFISC